MIKKGFLILVMLFIIPLTSYANEIPSNGSIFFGSASSNVTELKNIVRNNDYTLSIVEKAIYVSKEENFSVTFMYFYMDKKTSEVSFVFINATPNTNKYTVIGKFTLNLEENIFVEEISPKEVQEYDANSSIALCVDYIINDYLENETKE